MARAWWTALALVAALAAGVAGCGSGGDDDEGGGGTAKPMKIAFLAPGQQEEPEWSLQGRAVVEEFPERIGVRVDLADASKARTDDITPVLEQIAHEGNDLIITQDPEWVEEAEEVAAENRVPTLVWGARDNPENDYVASVNVEDKQGGYMAGILAAKAAYSRRLGIIVVAEGPDYDREAFNRLAGGFVAGARSVDPKTQFLYTQVGTGHGDATFAQARAAAKAQLAKGVQMMLVLGGKVALGAQRGLESKHGTGETLFIGVRTDKSSTVIVEEGGVPFQLGSIIWEPRPAYREAVRDVRRGDFGDHDYALTVRNRGVYLFTTGRAPQDALEEANAAGARIEEIDLPDTPMAEQVEALIARGG